MNEYLLTAFGVIFFSVIISFLIPEGKTNKIICSIVKIICILVLIQPVTDLFNNNKEINGNFADFEYVCTVYSQNQSREMEKVLLKEFGVETECAIIIGYDEDGFNVEKTEIYSKNASEEINNKIYAYLQDLGYINITVNEKPDDLYKIK